MNMSNISHINRREFLKNAGTLVAASALASAAIPRVHAAGSDTIQVALIGCGKRGTGAADNALSTQGGPIKLVAMADIFAEKPAKSCQTLQAKHKERMDLPPDQIFIGFDSYKQAMDVLKPGDVVIFATPPAFRWVHFKYAIEKNLNVFMEKPVTVDGPTSRRMFDLAEQASAKNLKVGVGLKSRHARPLHELRQRVQDGVLQRFALRVEQTLDFLAQCGIGGERLFHIRPPFPFRQLKSGAEDLFQTRPSLGRHVAVLAEISRWSHALAMAQSRFTVRGETLIASAVSSTVIPQK